MPQRQFLAALGSVFQVALDGASHLCQLTANLVVASGFQFDFQQVVAVALANYLVVQFSAFRVLHLVVV